MINDRLKKRSLEVKDYEKAGIHSKKNEINSRVLSSREKIPDDFENKIENNEIHF